MTDWETLISTVLTEPETTSGLWKVVPGYKLIIITNKKFGSAEYRPVENFEMIGTDADSVFCTPQTGHTFAVHINQPIDYQIYKLIVSNINA